MGSAVYALLDHGVFSTEIISGILTGVRLTEDQPVYEISFGKNKWWAKDIFEDKESLVEALKIPDLARVKQTHDLKIKFDFN